MPQVSIPIIDQLVHPSIGLLTRVPWPANPYGGPFITAAPPVTLSAITYGVVLRINSVSPGHGHDASFPVEYKPPLGKMCVTYTDLSHLIIIRQVTRWTYDDQDFVWDEPLPTLFNLYLYPNVSVNLFWLQT
jgi:hypothetical protein